MSVEETDLTPREHEALLLLARGLKREKIAQSMYVTYGTLSNMLSSAFDKLGVGCAVQAVVWVWAQGWIHGDDILI